MHHTRGWHSHRRRSQSCDWAYRRILTPYTKEWVESLRILLYTIGGQEVNGWNKVTEGVSGQSFNSGHGIHAPHIRSISGKCACIPYLPTLCSCWQKLLLESESLGSVRKSLTAPVTLQLSQTVKSFWDAVKWSRSKIDGQDFLTPVAALTMASIGVSPPCQDTRLPGRHATCILCIRAHAQCTMEQPQSKLMLMWQCHWFSGRLAKGKLTFQNTLRSPCGYRSSP